MLRAVMRGEDLEFLAVSSVADQSRHKVRLTRDEQSRFAEDRFHEGDAKLRHIEDFLDPPRRDEDPERNLEVIWQFIAPGADSFSDYPGDERSLLDNSPQKPVVRKDLGLVCEELCAWVKLQTAVHGVIDFA